MLTYAMTALAANKQARLAGQRATFGRVSSSPMAPTRCRRGSPPGWTQGARPTTPLASLVDEITRQGSERAGRDGTSLEVTAESVSGSVAFASSLAAEVAPDHEGGDWPIIPTQAGHDAGILGRGHPDRDAVRAQPDRGLALAGRARRDGRLPGRGRGARGHARSADPVTSYLLERAWVDGAVQRRRARRDRGRPVHLRRHRGGDRRRPALPGLTLPGLANCHSHAFHRALRGRTQRERGTFWTWREQMYGVAGRLDPDPYFALARATFREMAAAGITSVGEFHYLHHQPDGTPYDDPNAMGHALVEAAQEAGIRIALLDTCYLVAAASASRPRASRSASPTATPTAGPERRTAASRADDVIVGAAIHSVRAVPRDQIGDRRRGGRADGRCTCTCPSRSPRTTPASRRTASTPTQLLDDAGALGPRTTAVHATHLTADDIAPPRPSRHPRLLLPDHRARPRRRHRPGARAPRAGARSPSARTATRSSTCSRRCARSSSTSGSPPSSAGTGPPPSCSPPATAPRQPGVRRRRPDRGRPARRPGHPRPRPPAHRRHRRRRGDRRLRRHRRRRRPRGRRRPGRRHARRPRRRRPRAGRRDREGTTHDEHR